MGEVSLTAVEVKFDEFYPLVDACFDPLLIFRHLFDQVSTRLAYLGVLDDR